MASLNPLIAQEYLLIFLDIEKYERLQTLYNKSMLMYPWSV